MKAHLLVCWQETEKKASGNIQMSNIDESTMTVAYSEIIREDGKVRWSQLGKSLQDLSLDTAATKTGL